MSDLAIKARAQEARAKGNKILETTFNDEADEEELE